MTTRTTTVKLILIMAQRQLRQWSIAQEDCGVSQLVIRLRVRWEYPTDCTFSDKGRGPTLSESKVIIQKDEHGALSGAACTRVRRLRVALRGANDRKRRLERERDDARRRMESTEAR